jgi:hypothetical protein
MLLDQVFTDGAVYDIGLTQDPVVHGWMTNPPLSLEYLSIGAVRQGVDYNFPSDSVNNTESTGVVALPTGFPADNYWVLGTSFSVNDMQLTGYKEYTTLPQTLEIPLPDYLFENVAFDASYENLNWTLSGTSPSDVIQIDMVLLDSDFSLNTTWEVTLSSEATKWSVMELPEPAKTWFDISSMSTNVFYASISVTDWDLFSGFDEVWTGFILGIFPTFEEDTDELLMGEMLYGWQEFLSNLPPQAKGTIASKPISSDAISSPDHDRASLVDQLLGSFSGFRRR